MSAANSICSVARFEREEASVLRESKSSSIIRDKVVFILENDEYNEERKGFILSNYHLLHFCNDTSLLRRCADLYACLRYMRDSIDVCKSQRFFHALLPIQIAKEALQFASTNSILSHCIVRTGKFHCDVRSETLYWSIDAMRYQLLWAVRMAEAIERKDECEPIRCITIDREEFDGLFPDQPRPDNLIHNSSLYAFLTTRPISR